MLATRCEPSVRLKRSTVEGSVVGLDIFTSSLILRKDAHHTRPHRTHQFCVKVSVSWAAALLDVTYNYRTRR